MENSEGRHQECPAASFIVRPWTSIDCPGIMRMINELAVYEKMEDQVKMTAEKLESDGFGPSSFFNCLVAEDTMTHSLIGYMLFFYKYSTWLGRCIYLEDFYVSPDYRRRGIGRTLMIALSKMAVMEGCKRIEFSVLGWNTNAVEFYYKMGAVDLTQEEQWHFFRLDEDRIKAIVASAE